MRRIHRLVAIAFLGDDPDREVNHKDGNKGNNALSNLEWMTQSENTIHSYRVLGRRKADTHGAKNPSAKLTEEQVREILRLRSTGLFNHDIAAVFGVDKQTIQCITSGKTWKRLQAEIAGEPGFPRLILGCKGEHNGGCRFTNEQILQIRELHANGATCPSLASQFNTSGSNIWRIVRGQSWKHLLPTTTAD